MEIIYIDEKDKYDASASANSFAHNGIKNRVYINTLGAQLALKYLASENIDVSNISNIHSIKKVLEEIDISDIRLPNINIDVRVVFDENIIFIPKSHFEYNLVPDIYVVFHLSEDYSNVKFLGFFEPKLINKNNANKDYYFIEKEKLNSPLDLKNYIENYNKTQQENLSAQEFETCEHIIISMADHDVSEEDKKYLLQQLTKSSQLRDRFVEYENFEALSYKAATDSELQRREIPMAVNELETFESEPENAENEIAQPALLDEENSDIENLEPENLETLPFEDLELPPETTIEDMEAVPDALSDVLGDVNQDIEQDSIQDIGENIEQNIDEDHSITNIDELPVIEQETQIEETFELPDEDFVSLENLEEVSLVNIQEPVIENSTEEITGNIDELAVESIDLPEIVEGNVTEVLSDDNNEQQSEILLEDISLSQEEPLETIGILPDETESQNIIETQDIIEDEVKPQGEIENEVKTDFEELSSIDDILPDNNDENQESFGKNLLENLSSEETDEVSIENLGTTDTVETAQNISSDDLLGQIDDILNSSASVSEDETVNNETQDVQTADNLELNDNNDTEQLEVLFDADNETDNIQDIEQITEQPVPGAALYKEKPKTNKKTMILASVLAAVVLAGAAITFLKPKANEDIEPAAINDNLIDNPVKSENIMETNTPNINVPAKDAKETKPKQQIKELTSTPAAKKPISTAYLTVNKLVWDVPSTVSDNPKMQNYLRTAGKSIKLSLSADLLLATEYAYTNQVKLDLQINRNGNVQDAKIITSSGSDQIDKIVLQSVKDTLNVIKPSEGAVNTPNFNLSLIIYI